MAAQRCRSGVFLFSILFLFAASAIVQAEKEMGVRYDSRSLIVNGDRDLFFSGSIHYPRAPPEVKFDCFLLFFFFFCFIEMMGEKFCGIFQMWLDLIKKAKEGGLNVIQTYIFWNIHEPVEGQVIH